MTKFRIGNHLTPFMLTLCGLLAGILVLQSRNMTRSPAEGIAHNTPPDLAVSNTEHFTAPELAAYSEIIERPLFREGRTPPPPAAKRTAPTAPKRSPLRLQLTGVAVTPEIQIAVVRDLGSKKMLRLTRGMKHQGWELTDVSANSATFKRDDRSEELLLKVKRKGHQR